MVRRPVTTALIHKPPSQRPAAGAATGVLPAGTGGGEELLTGQHVYSIHASAALRDRDAPFGHQPTGEPVARWMGAATVVAPVRSRQALDTASARNYVWVYISSEEPWVYIMGEQLTRTRPAYDSLLASCASSLTEPSQASQPDAVQERVGVCLIGAHSDELPHAPSSLPPPPPPSHPSRAERSANRETLMQPRHLHRVVVQTALEPLENLAPPAHHAPSSQGMWDPLGDFDDVRSDSQPQ